MSGVKKKNIVHFSLVFFFIKEKKIDKKHQLVTAAKSIDAKKRHLQDVASNNKKQSLM